MSPTADTLDLQTHKDLVTQLTAEVMVAHSKGAGI